MRATCVVEGDPDALVPDLCATIAAEFDWAEYGETVIPEDSYPRGTITPSAAEHVAGGLKIETDVNQGAPEWSDGSAEPDTSAVRLVLTQPLTHDLEDISVFVARRSQLRRFPARAHRPADRGPRLRPGCRLELRRLARCRLGVTWAVLTKAQLRAAIDAVFASMQKISAEQARAEYHDWIDSLLDGEAVVAGSGITVSRSAGVVTVAAGGAAAATGLPSFVMTSAAQPSDDVLTASITGRHGLAAVPVRGLPDHPERAEPGAR